MSERTRVILADDHELVLEGLRALLEAEPDMDVVAVATSGERLLALARLHRPDVVVLDLEMGKMDGLACLVSLREQRLSKRNLVLTAFSDGESMRAALESGADGYALKTEPPRQTVDAIREVARGRLVFPQAARRWLLARGTQADRSELTEREQAVLALVAEGATNQIIAGRLRVSENTIKFHLQNLYAKLGVANRTEAAAQYLKTRGIRSHGSATP